MSADGIVAYFKKQVGPSSVILTDEDQLQKFISDEDASVVGECLTSAHSTSASRISASELNVCVGEEPTFVFRTKYSGLFFPRVLW